jgi:hypothetical protein
MPEEPEHGEPGRDLPPEILRQVCGHLETLASPAIRTAIEILIDTGRRPDDVVSLPLDCLASEPGGAPVLVYDNHKAHRLGRRLPIPAATAALIRAQQAVNSARTALSRTPTGIPTPKGTLTRASRSTCWPSCSIIAISTLLAAITGSVRNAAAARSIRSPPCSSTGTATGTLNVLLLGAGTFELAGDRRRQAALGSHRASVR